MPIPKSRAELFDLVTKNAAKLAADLEQVDGATAGALCTEDWTVRDLLVVRAWWTESVLEWIEAGRQGQQPVVPAEGYAWKETPRLNADLVANSGDPPFADVVRRLRRGVERVLTTIEALTDEELLEVGVFEWAGKWPIARWISINTATQYATARTMIRRVLRARGLL